MILLLGIEEHHRLDLPLLFFSWILALWLMVEYPKHDVASEWRA